VNKQRRKKKKLFSRAAMMSIASAILVTFALLALVSIFEKQGISVSGSREMWIGLIGTLIGGVYTMLGVVLSLSYQSENDDESKRLENLPLLKFDIRISDLNTYDFSDILTMDGYKLYSTAFPRNEYEHYPVIDVSLANNRAAFDLCIESTITRYHRRALYKTKHYFPSVRRLVSDEKHAIMFWIKDYEEYEVSNIQGFIRFTYKDIFNNRYFQDVNLSTIRQLRTKKT